MKLGPFMMPSHPPERNIYDARDGVPVGIVGGTSIQYPYANPRH